MFRRFVPALLACGALLLGSGGVHAQSASSAQVVVDRQPTGLSRPATQLFATPTGTLFAATATGLFRSDDSAATWQPAPLPDLSPQTTLALVTLEAGGRLVAYAARRSRRRCRH